MDSVTWSVSSGSDGARVRELYGLQAGEPWITAVHEAQRIGRQINMHFIGDSLFATKTPVDYIRAMFWSTLGNGGLGYVALNNTMTVQEGMSFGVGTGSQQTNVQFAAGTDAIYNPTLYSLLFTSAVNSIVSLDDKLHEFDSATAIYLKKSGGGTFNFRDQLLPTTGNILVDTAAATKELGFTTRSGWPLNTKSNKLQAVVNGNVQLIGFDLKRGSTGVRIHRTAQPGTKLRQVAQIDGDAYTAFLQQTGCDIALVDFGMNDAPSGTATQYEADLRTLLDRVRAANPYSAIVLVKMNETNDSSKNAVLETYRNIISKEVAKDYNAMVWDDRFVLGSYEQANAAGLMDDETHPSSIGNYLRANAFFKFLGGSALSDVGKALTG